MGRITAWPRGTGILIKETHIAAAGGIAAVQQQAQALNAGVEIQIEVENLDEHQALAAGATNILLDDFSLEECERQCSSATDAPCSRCPEVWICSPSALPPPPAWIE